MNNYSYYCEDCKEFFSTSRTKFKRRENKYNSMGWDSLCPKCKEPFGAINCYWMLVVGHHYSGEFVRQKCVGIDTLVKMCYNCDSRFKCWTESL